MHNYFLKYIANALIAIVARINMNYNVYALLN